MWPYESVTKILPEEAVKNVTELKLPPYPAPQPHVPAKTPNQALASPQDSKNNASMPEDILSSTNNATSGTNGSSQGNKSAPGDTGLRNDTVNSKVSEKNETLNLTSSNAERLDGKIESKNDSRSENKKGAEDVKKQENKEAKIERNNKTNAVEQGGDKKPESADEPGTATGKLVDPAAPTNESVVQSTPATGIMDEKKKVTENKEQESSKIKASEVKIADQTKAGTGAQESVSEKNAEQQQDQKIKNKAISAATQQSPAKEENYVQQQQPVQNTETAKTNQQTDKQAAGNIPAQNSPAPLDKLAQNSPAPVEKLAQSSPTPSDQLAQNRPASNNVPTKEKTVSSEELTENRPAPGGTMEQNKVNVPLGQSQPTQNGQTVQQVPEKSIKLAQNSPAPSEKLAQNSPAPSEKLAQNSPAPSEKLAQNSPAPSEKLAQNSPAPSEKLAQNSPAPSEKLAQNSPAPSEKLAQNSPAPSEKLAQNSPAPSEKLAQNSPAPSEKLTESNAVPDEKLAQNKPDQSTTLAQLNPAGHNDKAQKNPMGDVMATPLQSAPGENAAKVNAKANEDLYSDIFADDTSPLKSSPVSNQLSDNSGGQMGQGNLKPATGLASANPQAINNQQVNQLMKDKAAQTVNVVDKNPLTHEKMIELSSPPITNIGKTNFASEKDLYLPFKNLKPQGVERPVDIINKFTNDKGGNQQPPKVVNVAQQSASPSKPDQLGDINSVFEAGKPGEVNPTIKPAGQETTPLKPTAATKKSPETLEEFEDERLKKQGFKSSMDEALLKSLPILSGESRPQAEQPSNNTSLWIDDYGLLGDTPWVRTKAPEAPKSEEKGKGTEGIKKDEDEKKKTEKKKEGKDERNGDEKDKKVEKAEEKRKEKKEREKNGNEKSKDDKEVSSKNEKIKGKEINETASSNANKSTNASEKKTEKANEKDKETENLKNDGKSKNDTKTDESKEKGRDVEEKVEARKGDRNETENVLNSKVSYQYIENKTTPMDNHEYHEALSKYNETQLDTKKVKNKTAVEQESMQAQNFITTMKQNKTQGTVNQAPSALPDNSKMSTSIGDIHQISSASPIHSVLPLAALPVSTQEYPQFFVSSPVSNQSSTTTTTGIIPIDPQSGQRVFNTSLALVALRGDEGTIPESAFTGSDQADWMKKNSKKNIESEAKGFVATTKIPGGVEYNIDEVGKRKSEIKPKSLVPESRNKERKEKGSIEKYGLNHEIKRTSFSKLKNALEGTNVTIENGVNTHMTFKSFVPRLSYDDIIDEQKRSSVPMPVEKHHKSATTAEQSKRSWEKKLGNIMGAVEGTNFSIQNGVTSQLTFKSNIAPIKLKKTEKSKKRLEEDADSSSEGASQRSKGEGNEDIGLIESKGKKADNGKGNQKRKAEFGEHKTRKKYPDGKKKKETDRNKGQTNGKEAKRVGEHEAGKKEYEAKKEMEDHAKRSETQKSLFQNKIGSHKIGPKGANHSEANMVSSFSGSKNAKESKSVTITNIDKENVKDDKDKNGTLIVDSKENGKKNGTEGKAGGNEKLVGKGKNMEIAEVQKANRTHEKEVDEEKKNETNPKPPERGVFEPDIGTMKKMRETTDIKHHIVGSNDSHSSVQTEGGVSLIKGNLAEHKINENNTLHAVYNMREINDTGKGSSTDFLVKGIKEHYIDEQSVLHAVYNMKPRGGNGTNSTSEDQVKSIEGHSNDKTNAVYNVGMSGEMTNQRNSNSQTRESIAGRKKHRKKKKSIDKSKVKQKMKKLRNKSDENYSLNEKKKSLDEIRNYKVVNNLHNFVTKIKENSSAKKIKETNKVKGINKDERKDYSQDSLNIVINGNKKKEKAKKLKSIGLVLSEKDRKVRKKEENGGQEEAQKSKNKNLGSDEKKTKKIAKVSKPTNRVSKAKQQEKKKLAKNKENKINFNHYRPTGKRQRNGREKSGKAGKGKLKKGKMEAKLDNEKQERQVTGVKINSILEKVKKIAQITSEKSGKRKKRRKGTRKAKEAKSESKNEFKSQGKKRLTRYEEELKDKQKRKNLQTIFFPQVFMKRTQIPTILKDDLTKGNVRQLIQTKVGDIEPSNGELKKGSNEQGQTSKNSDQPQSVGTGGDNKTNPGNALYENNNGTAGQQSNNSKNSTGEQGSKNSVDPGSDIDQVLNLTVGFLNKTFHDHFGKGIQQKDKTNGSNAESSGRKNMTNSEGNSNANEARNESRNGTEGDLKNNFTASKNESKSINGTGVGSNGVNTNGNSSVTQNNTEGVTGQNGTMSPSANQTANSTADGQSKPSSTSAGFRSERIPGQSHATAVSDMMSPIENYILNIINETGQQKFGNQSSPDGKRGSTASNETSATGMKGLAALLAKAKGQLNLKSNQVNIKLSPKGDDSAAGLARNLRTGAGIMLNIASKRSMLDKNEAKSKGKNVKKWKSKNEKKGNVKTLGKSKPSTTAMNAENKAPKTVKRVRKISKAAPTVGGRSGRGSHKHLTTEKIAKKSSTKSGIRFGTTHKLQRITTLSRGAATAGFVHETMSDGRMPDDQSKGKSKNSPKLKGEVPNAKSKNNEQKHHKDTKILTKKKETKNEDWKSKSKRKKEKKKENGNRMKRQNEATNSNQGQNQNGGNWPIRIDGQKIDWGPVSENWPNYGSG